MNLNMSFTSAELWTILGSSFVFLLVLIGLLRLYINRQTKSALAGKYKGQSLVKVHNKYPEVDAFKFRNTILFFSLALVLGITTVLFNWTTYDQAMEEEDIVFSVTEDIEIEPPRTMEAPPPPPPPPPPPVIEEVPEEFLTEEDDVEFVDQYVEEKTEVFAPPPKMKKEKKAPPPPPPPPPPPKAQVKEIFKVVEQMPRFPACETMEGSHKDKKLCADKKLYEYIYSQISYPAIARENNVEGTVVVQFVVETDGTVTNARVVRDIGATCGDEALRVVRLMSNLPEKWIPGKQRGIPVRVMFTLPVRFKLLTS